MKLNFYVLWKLKEREKHSKKEKGDCFIVINEGIFYFFIFSWNSAKWTELVLYANDWAIKVPKTYIRIKSLQLQQKKSSNLYKISEK